MGPNVRVSGSEPSLDAFSKRSDVISSIKIHSLLVVPHLIGTPSGLETELRTSHSVGSFSGPPIQCSRVLSRSKFDGRVTQIQYLG